MADGGAEFSSKEDIHVKRRFAVYVERISLRVVVTVGVSSPQGWRCSWLHMTSGPPRPLTMTVPDTQMGQTVSLSASGAEEANSLI